MRDTTKMGLLFAGALIATGGVISYVRATNPELHSWYITYTAQTETGGSSTGAVAVHAQTSLFPIGAATKYLKEMTKSNAVVVTNWQEITPAQENEFNPPRPPQVPAAPVVPKK